MSTSDPIEEWLLEDFIEDMEETAKGGMYYEIAPEYAERFVKLLKERLDTLMTKEISNG